ACACCADVMLATSIVSLAVASDTPPAFTAAPSDDQYGCARALYCPCPVMLRVLPPRLFRASEESAFWPGAPRLFGAGFPAALKNFGRANGMRLFIRGYTPLFAGAARRRPLTMCAALRCGS